MPGRRGVRLAPVPEGQTLHELHRPRARGELDRSLQRRGSITRTGNAHLRGQLCEVAWAYQHSPNVGVGIRERQKGVSPETVARSWAAQVRLSKRSDNWPPIRTLAPSWLPPSPVSSPGSSGLRWWPRSERHGLPVGQRAIGAADWSSPPRRAGATPQQIRSSPVLCPPSLLVSMSRAPDSEAPACEWLYCDFDTRTSSWRFSDPLRSGGSSMACPTATISPPGPLRLLRNNQAPHLWCVAVKKQ